MTTDGVRNSTSIPETLPPKKRNSRENLNEAPVEPVFKTPSVFWNQSSFKRTRRSREPATASVIDLHSAATYYPQWPDVRQTFPHPLWDSRSYPSFGQQVAGSGHLLSLSNFNKNYPIAVQDFYKAPPYWSYIPAEPRDVYVKSYGGIPNQNGSKIIKPVPRSFVPHYTPEATRGEEIGRQFERDLGNSSRDIGMQSKRARKSQNPGQFVESSTSIHSNVYNSEFKDLSQACTNRTENLQHHRISTIQQSGFNTEQLTTRDYRPLVVSGGSAETQQQQESVSPSLQVLSRFVEGSLIELEGGRLKRVENLQMEDFEHCTESCQEFSLKKFTVRKITCSDTPGLACLEVEVEDDLQSKISLEVCAEYPFFVCERGWSSCSPERTARLCYLRCHQLQLGDVCLALTPVLVPTDNPTLPGTGVGDTVHLDRENGTEKGTKVSRLGKTGKRHHSAPELRNVL